MATQHKNNNLHYQFYVHYVKVRVLLPILGWNIHVIFCKTFQTRIQVLYTVHNDTLTRISLKVKTSGISHGVIFQKKWIFNYIAMRT